MPIIQRLVQSEYKVNEKIYTDQRVKKEEVLNNICAAKVVGLLRQMKEVSDFASKMFTELITETKATNTRICNFNDRFTRLEQRIPEVTQYLSSQPPKEIFGVPHFEKDFRRKPETLSQDLFNSSARPESMNVLRERALELPNLKKMNKYYEGRDLSKEYSNPQYFVEEWLRKEEQLFDDMKAKKKDKKKKKRKKRKKQKMKVAQAERQMFDPVTGERIKTAKNTDTTTDVVDEYIEEQDYEDDDAQGRAFATKRMQTQQASTGVPYEEEYTAYQAPVSTPSIAPPPAGPPAGLPTGAPPAPNRGPPSSPPPSGPPSGMPPPPAGRPGGPPPPGAPRSPAMGGPPSAPPMAPAIGGPPSAPPIAPAMGGPPRAPPMAPAMGGPPSAAPMAPAMGGPPSAPPMAPAMGGPAAPPMAPARGGPPAPGMPRPAAPSGGRGDLLSAIQAGRSLKKSAPVQPKKSAAPSLLDQIEAGKKLRKANARQLAPAKKDVNSRDTMLDAIRGGMKLKKVEVKKEPEPEEEKGPPTGVMAILARRAAIEDSESEEEDEDWE